MKKRSRIQPSMLRALAALIVATALFPTAEAAAIQDAVFKDGKILVTFDSSLTKPEDQSAAIDQGKYLLMDSSSQRRVYRFQRARLQTSSGIAPFAVWLDLEETADVDPAGAAAPYFLFAFGLSFDGKPIDAPLQGKVGEGDIPPDPASARFEFSGGKTRDDSNVYFSGEIGGASGAGPFFTVDAKVAPVVVREFWGKVHEFSPFFDLRASSSPTADPDAMSFGGEWSFPIFSPGGFLADILWSNSGKIEAQRSFDTANAVWDSRMVFVLNPKVRRGLIFQIDPFLGLELGRNLKNLLPGVEDESVARPYVGSNLYLKVRRFALEGSYIRRWPLREEIQIVNRNEKLVAVLLGKSPREYADVKLLFKINPYVDVFGGYEYGELPPAFETVDHRFRFGLVYKLKITPPGAN